MRKLAWAVGIPRHLKVYSADVQMVWPVAKRGRPRQRHVPDVLSIPAEDMLAHAKWHTISWRTGTKGKLKARFAAATGSGVSKSAKVVLGSGLIKSTMRARRRGRRRPDSCAPVCRIEWRCA